MAEATVEKKKYNVLENHLNALTKEKISLDEKEQKRYNQYLNEVLNQTLVPAMKDKDEIFSCLYKRFHYAGSYYENLKVGKPNEFDLNIEFKLPASEFKIIDGEQPGFVQVKIETFDENESRRCFQKIPDWQTKLKKLWMDEDNFLDRNKVSSWMQGVVDKSLREFVMTRSINGPAVTLNINQTNPQGDLINFSVDLVPIFVFAKNDWPPSMRQPIDESSPEKTEWCVVPKPPHNQYNVRFWRVSFYAQERSLMIGKFQMKKALKLIKLLRDEQNWKGLASYYIKTVFLWETTEQEPQFWSQNSVSCLLMHMLRKMMSCFEKKKISFFWDERHNLLVTRDPQELENIQNRIKNILKKVDQNLEANPQKILTFFGWSDDQSSSSARSSDGDVGPRASPARSASTSSLFQQQPKTPDSTDASQPSSSAGATSPRVASTLCLLQQQPKTPDSTVSSQPSYSPTSTPPRTASTLCLLQQQPKTPDSTVSSQPSYNPTSTPPRTASTLCLLQQQPKTSDSTVSSQPNSSPTSTPSRVSSSSSLFQHQPETPDSVDSSQPSSSTTLPDSSSDAPPQAQATNNDNDDDIDWNLVESIISVGAVAGALFAAGVYLLIRNAQRQSRRQQGNNNS